jgi:hypothetical protein
VCPQSPQNFVPAEPGQHDVENDRVKLFLGRVPEPVSAVGRANDHETFCLQALADRRRKPGFILDQQNSHRVRYLRALQVAACWVASGSREHTTTRQGWTAVAEEPLKMRGTSSI